jgi:uncharacterized protein YdeI (YjbR/CyaY-like superfamily)
MNHTDPRFDAYIAKSAAFAQPILEHFRMLVHKGCPETEEVIKWGMPHFEYKGENLCSMAAFKQHCAFGFWKASLMKDPTLVENAKSETAMGHLGKITSIQDLPSDKIILSYIKEAKELNDKGIRLTKKTPQPSLPVETPVDLQSALKRNKIAKETFEAFSNSHRKEYVEWINEAKTDATREKRIEKTVSLLEEKKSLNWKYQQK